MLSLPTLEEVEATDHKLGSALSDLDDFAHRVERMCGDTQSVDDYAFMVTAKVTLPSEPIAYDGERFARLLVFADELVEDAERLRKDAERLRAHLLQLYRSEVTDGPR